MGVLSGFRRAREKLRDNHPIIAAVADAARAVASDPANSMTEEDASRVANTVVDIIAARPEARAEANVERWWENRYIVAIITAGIGWLLNLFNVHFVITSDKVVEWGPFVQSVGGWIFARAATVSLPPWDWRHPIKSLLGFRRLDAPVSPQP